jgi:DNA-binding beta-propeller fold protein YncE
MLCLLLVYIFLSATDVWGWASFKKGPVDFNDHGKLAIKTERCVSLPKPPQKKCEKPVDDSVLYTALKFGSAEPDNVDPGGDRSPKHSYNPSYGATWNSDIQAIYGVDAQINAGIVRETIWDEIYNGETGAKVLLHGLTCESTSKYYENVWRKMGRLSHYSSDLASPLHAYSVSVNNLYREGDLYDKWIKGLYELGTPGKHFHWQTEIAMGEAIDGVSCTNASNIPPANAASNARFQLNHYTSPMGNGAGFLAMIKDYEKYNAININFFKDIGPQQVKDGIGAIKNVWTEALTGFTPPSNCDQPPTGGCGDCGGGSCPPPGGDHPDDNFSVATTSASSFSSDEILEQVWDRMAVKKDKQSLIWFWMQSYLNGEYRLGNMDEAAYRSRSQSYGLTSEVAWELFYNDYITTPDVAILGRGFALSMSDLMQNKFNEPVRRYTVNDFSPVALKDYPVFVIPSGGLMGLEDSEVFKASLDEYVKQGGTLVVFAQQHGYEFSTLPVPQETDGTYRKIAGYGWAEDQSCFANAAYIDTQHQILSSISNNTPTLSVDGYFSNYPSNTTVLLRRTANGQPALIMYDHGLGKVVVTSMYSDFALKSNQTSAGEIALVRDMISWAKKPAQLPEVRPGQTVSVSLEAVNNTALDAASVKVTVYSPDRATLLSEQTITAAIPAGQADVIPVSYLTTLTSVLGIYHVDFELYDSAGIIIQPQAETDSGRFAVSNPAKTGAPDKPIWFSVSTTSQEVLFGTPFNYTFHIWNNTDQTRNLKIKQVLPHTHRNREWNIVVTSNSETTIADSDPFLDNRYMYETMRAYLYDEVGREIGSYMLSFKGSYPSANITTQADKLNYAKGENIAIKTTVTDTSPVNSNYQPEVKTTVVGPKSIKVFEETITANLSSNRTADVVTSFILSPNSDIGTYTVKTEAWYGIRLESSASTRFELPQSQISVTPALPTLVAGLNTIPFTLHNTGKIPVSSGVLDVNLKDPDGVVAYSFRQPFALAIGESKILEVPVVIPLLKLGEYIITYMQSDETRTGKATKISSLNAVAGTISLDKASYKVRETANLTVDLTNSGDFDISGGSLIISVPDAGYTNSRAINLGPGQKSSVQFSIEIPSEVTAGQHDITAKIMLPSGDMIVEDAKLTVAASSLSTEYSGATILNPGDMIPFTITNTGGVDTTYVIDKLTLTDNQGVVIWQDNSTGSIMAGETKTLNIVKLPSQTVKGPLFMDLRLSNEKTGEIVQMHKVLEIDGLNATLQTITDKDVYLKSEPVTGLTDIFNGQTEIEEGRLMLTVKKLGEAAGDQFSKFLPASGWHYFNSPKAITIGPDGHIQIVDHNYNSLMGDSYRILKFDKDMNFISDWGKYGVDDGQFKYPSDIAVGPDGSIYIVDAGNKRVQKFNADGEFISKWSGGYGYGSFNSPFGVAVSDDGYVYITDSIGRSVWKFDNEGFVLKKWRWSGPASWFGGIPYGIDIDSGGYVFVTDDLNNTIQKFDKDGLYNSVLYGFSSPNDVSVSVDGYIYVADGGIIKKFDKNQNFIRSWPTGGSSIAVDHEGFIYSASAFKNSIEKYDNDGVLLKKWGSSKDSDGQFSGPRAMTIGADGSFYIADSDNNRIQKLSHTGEFVTKWGSFCLNRTWTLETPSGEILERIECDGGQFAYPADITAGSAGHLYVADMWNNRIQKFDANGTFISMWGSEGSGPAEFNMPFGVAVDNNNFVYVTDSSNNRIQKFDANGTFISMWGSQGNGLSEFNMPYDAAVDTNNFIYVTDSLNNRIQKFDQDGNLIAIWGSYGNESGQFDNPQGIFIDFAGFIYVSDSNNDRIQKFDGNGNFVAQWGGAGSDYGKFHNPTGIIVDGEGTIYVSDTGNNRIQKLLLSSQEFLFESTIPINQAANTTQKFITDIGILNTTGKLYLQAELKNSLGQTIATAEYPFYILEGDTLLQFSTDKKVYRPGETVTITGEVKNLAAITASALNLQLSADGRSIYSAVFDLPGNGSHPFTTTISTSTEGTYTLTGKVTQNSSTLAEITDQYEVASPEMTVAVTLPDIAGSDPFEINLEIKNEGKVDASIQLSSATDQRTFDNHQITVPAGETKLIQYSQQITDNTQYTFTFTGDLEETITKIVSYGLSASISLSLESVYPEGKVAIPVTITNTGQLDETLNVVYSLQPSALTETKTYYIPIGGSTTDILYYDLTEGSYQLTAISSQPAATASLTFSVKKENNVTMDVGIGTQNNELIPTIVNLTNLGYNSIDGSVQLSIVGTQGSIAWNSSQDVSLFANPQAPTPSPYSFNINPSAIIPGDYTLKAELLNNGNQQLVINSQPITIKGPVFQITQLPTYQTFNIGQEASFTFKVKNTGSQEGALDFSLKSYDLIDAIQREWLKPGEEKTISFSFMLPDDLEAKDYFADYELKAVSAQQSAINGQIKYHLAGINLNVNASLDKQYYSEGDTAHLTIAVSNQQSANSQNLFARVNYAGHESQQTFTIGQGQAQTLQFEIPLTQITGEKLFYGIYHESGRSIHLNSLYIYKAGEVITITIDKQVYNPGETVTTALSSQLSAVSGTTTLTAPDYSETIDFNGFASKSFTLPSIMTAGTYTLSAQLSTVSGETYTASHPFDVSGIQIKVLECTNNKGKYAASDTISTNFTISGNTTMPATLKAWIVDPEGKYTSAGEKSINLTSVGNLLLTSDFSLMTAVSGIHRLVYGIYAGDILLVSGSEAFDVGDAVLLGLSTDKPEYPTNAESVSITVSMFGTVDANLELQLDGTTVKAETVSLSGFETISHQLAAIKPGTHTLKGVLAARGLQSTKETSFVYGSNLPDLTTAISNQQTAIGRDNTLQITTTVINQGKTPAASTILALYDGDSLIETKQVNAMNSGDSQEMTFVWNVLGKAGERNIKAVVDPDNLVSEFNEGNNTASIVINVPDMSLITETDKDTYKIRQKVNISSTITNLTSSKTYNNLVILTSVKDPSGNEVYNNSTVLTAIEPSKFITHAGTWNTSGMSLDGMYTITSTILLGSQPLTQNSKTVTLEKAPDFTIGTDTDYKKIKQGEKALYTAYIDPLNEWNSAVSLNIEGLPAGSSVSFEPGMLMPPGEALTLVITTDATPAGIHTVNLIAEGIDGGEVVTHALPLTLDISGYALEADTEERTIKQLESTTFSINLLSFNGYEGEVSLNIEGMPYGIKASLDASSLSTPGSTKLNILTSKYVKSGPYQLKVTGDDSITRHSVDLILTVNANPEIAAGIITSQGPGPNNKAVVKAFNPVLQPVFELKAFDTQYGVNVASADIDGDGHDEVIVAQGPDPKNAATLRVFKKNGTFVCEYTVFDSKYGMTISSADIDGDWKDELIVGMGPDPKNPAVLKILKYNDNGFTEMMSRTMYPDTKYGINTATGDIDGDGIPEIITAPGPGPDNEALIKIWKPNGQTLMEIGSFIAFDGSYGANISTGDIDGDGVEEIIAGTGPDPKNLAVVRVYKADGTRLLSFMPYDDKHSYGVTVASADMDEDGMDEIITGLGPGPQNPSWVKVFKADGTEVGSFYSFSGEVNYGAKVFRGRTGNAVPAPE